MLLAGEMLAMLIMLNRTWEKASGRGNVNNVNNVKFLRGPLRNGALGFNIINIINIHLVRSIFCFLLGEC